MTVKTQAISLRLVLAGLSLLMATMVLTGCPGAGGDSSSRVYVSGVEINGDSAINLWLPPEDGNADPAWPYRITLEATVLPPNATNKNVIWISGDEDIATVVNGVVTAVGAGDVEIHVGTVDGGHNDWVIVRVREVGDAILVTGVDIYRGGVLLGESLHLWLPGGDDDQPSAVTLTAAVRPRDATNSEVTWASDDEDVATVENGVVTAVAAGYAVITVTTVDGGHADSVTVYVWGLGYGPPAVSSVSIETEEGESALTIGANQTFTLTATVLPEDAIDRTVTWGGYSPYVELESEGGFTATFRGVSSGAASITATAGGMTSEPVVVTVRARVTHTWDFLATPAIPGWAPSSGTPAAAASVRNIMDVVFEHNMMLLPSRLSELNETDGQMSGGGISWAPAGTRDPVANTGWIQTHAASLEDEHPIWIANVQGPFTVRVSYTGTGGTQAGSHRRALVFVDGVAIAAETGGVTLPVHGDVPDWLVGTPAGPESTGQDNLATGVWQFTEDRMATIQINRVNNIRFYQIVVESYGLGSAPVLPGPPAFEPRGVEITTSGNNLLPDVDFGGIFTVGGTLQLDARVIPGRAPQYVDWASDNHSVATVNDTGLITFQGPGAATIIAAVRGVPDLYAEFTIRLYAPGTLPPTSITISPTAITNFWVGTTRNLTAAVFPALATDEGAIGWAITAGSSNAAFVNDDSTGSAVAVTALAPGNVTVTVTQGAVIDSISFEVSEMPAMPPAERNFVWEFAAAPPIPGWTATAGATPNDAASLRNITDTTFVNNMMLHPSALANLNETDAVGSGAGISWAPNDTRPGNPGWIQSHGNSLPNAHPILIANVQGPFTLRVLVTGTGGSHPATDNRRAIVFVDGIAIPASNGVASLSGTNVQEWQEGLPAGPAATGQAASVEGVWEYSGTGVVTIGINRAGNLRFSRISLEAAIPLESVNIGDDVSLPHGATLNLSERIVFTPADASNTSVTWSSSDQSVASVTQAGVVTVNTPTGSALITATPADTNAAPASITVTAIPPSVTAVEITGQTSAASGAVFTLTANVLPATVTERGVTWEVTGAASYGAVGNNQVSITAGADGTSVTAIATSVALNVGGETVASAAFVVEVRDVPAHQLVSWSMGNNTVRTTSFDPTTGRLTIEGNGGAGTGAGMHIVYVRVPISRPHFRVDVDFHPQESQLGNANNSSRIGLIVLGRDPELYGHLTTVPYARLNYRNNLNAGGQIMRANRSSVGTGDTGGAAVATVGSNTRQTLSMSMGARNSGTVTFEVRGDVDAGPFTTDNGNNWIRDNADYVWVGVFAMTQNRTDVSRAVISNFRVTPGDGSGEIVVDLSQAITNLEDL